MVTAAVRRAFGSGEEKIKVRGIDDLMVFRARCCNPIRGEKIVGYITRGKGVAVHSINCPNVTNLMYEPERKIDVEWARDESTPTAYPVKLTVFCDDRFGMLKSITGVIGDAKSNIKNITAHTANSQASVEVVLDIADLKHLEQIIAGLRKIPGVHEVQRLQKI
jgi:GTP pyrophosphokinase